MRVNNEELMVINDDFTYPLVNCHIYGKIHKSTISMAMFNSFLYVYQRVYHKMFRWFMAFMVLDSPFERFRLKVTRLYIYTWLYMCKACFVCLTKQTNMISRMLQWVQKNGWDLDGFGTASASSEKISAVSEFPPQLRQQWRLFMAMIKP